VLINVLRDEQANESARQQQAQLMMSRLSAAAAGISNSEASNGANGAADGGPLVILCGDFNDSPSSSACQVHASIHRVA
jgi:endonuclease/exonuclease/phosphatase family metal-dependent hydrolase